MFRKERDFEEAKKLAEKMKDMILHFKVKAGEGGKLFGSVTAKDISDKLLSEYKIETDKKKVYLDDAIKSAGITTVEIKLFEGVIAKIKVEITAE
jgi:large subunit ribosomal protein L9